MSQLVKRLELGDWALIIGSLSMILLLAVFLTIAVRYFLLPKASLDKMARLPFDDPPAAKADKPLSPDQTSPNDDHE